MVATVSALAAHTRPHTLTAMRLIVMMKNRLVRPRSLRGRRKTLTDLSYLTTNRTLPACNTPPANRASDPSLTSLCTVSLSSCSSHSRFRSVSARDKKGALTREMTNDVWLERRAAENVGPLTAAARRSSALCRSQFESIHFTMTCIQSTNNHCLIVMRMRHAIYASAALRMSPHCRERCERKREQR
jgi:hypothetical protein